MRACALQRCGFNSTELSSGIMGNKRNAARCDEDDDDHDDDDAMRCYDDVRGDQPRRPRRISYTAAHGIRVPYIQEMRDLQLLFAAVWILSRTTHKQHNADALACPINDALVFIPPSLPQLLHTRCVRLLTNNKEHTCM